MKILTEGESVDLKPLVTSILPLHSMPNVEADREANGTSSNEHKSKGKSPGDHLQENVKSFNVSVSTNLGSGGERNYPWGCPVTHTREKFYTVCSDYAFLNQATSLCKTTSSVSSSSSQDKPALNNTLNYIDLQASGSDTIYNEDATLDSLSSDLGTLPLAWEIDTSEFNTMTTKIKTKPGEVHKIQYSC